jgi:4-amino-4-deoxy-L-arabinose transferase-like glycosyltransferase
MSFSDDRPTTPTGWMPYIWNHVLFPSSADTNDRIRPLSLMLLLLLPAMLLYPCRAFHLFEPDEGRYAQIPKEMLETGNWVVPTLQGEPYLDKPPLMYWLIAISYKLFGASEATARIVPAVCVHLTILAVYLIGRRSVGERGAFWAGTLLCVAPGFLSIARLLLLDGLLTLCVTTSVLSGYEAVRTGVLKRGWWVTAALCSGLGFLTKGPISEVLLFPPLLAIGWLTKSTASIGWKNLLLFLGILVAVNLPWYVAIGFHRPEFLGYFFWEHNVMRFLKPFDHLQPVWYYAPILLVGFLPGAILAVPYVRSLLRGESNSRSAAGGFWLLSGVWILAFFSVSGSKLPTYILPAFPPLALALGEYIARSQWDRLIRTRALMAGCAVLLAVLHYLAVPWYAKERSPMGRPELVEQYLRDPKTTVVTYPRNVDSVAFYSGRSNLTPIRTKDANRMIRECHLRERTVILFTHDHSLAGFKEALRGAVNCTVQVTEETNLRKTDGPKWIQDLLGGGPWGLCDIAVVEPRKGTIAQPAAIEQVGAVSKELNTK